MIATITIMIGTTTTIVITTAIEVRKCGGAGFSLHRQLLNSHAGYKPRVRRLVVDQRIYVDECFNRLPSRLHRVRRGQAV
jgi:hypothetical protein